MVTEKLVEGGKPLPQEIRFTGLNREGMRAVNFPTINLF
jgi:hypothetical protein